MSTSADLGIQYIAGQQAQPEITHNTALNQLQIMQTGVVNVGSNTPPGSPAQGDCYILGGTPTGAWAGRAHCLAGYFGTAWVFVPGNDSSGTAITMGVRHEGLSVWSKADNALYVWSGTAWTAPTAGMTNPMTTAQDLIVGGASGAPARLAVGTNGFVLSVVAGAVAWAAATGFANPMTTAGDIILGGASGAPGRLAIGTNGYVLTVSGGTAAWVANAAMLNPMTTSGDIIYGGASGVATRLAAGTNGHILTLASGVPAWAANSAMANPMTTAGDLILGGASGVAGRLGIGTNGYVLTVSGGTAVWAANAAMSNPMTTAGDLILGGASGAAGRLGIGSTGQVLTVVGGTAAWASGGGSITVQDEGSTLTTAVTKFNFAGTGVTVTEPVTDEMLVTIGGNSWVSAGTWTYSSDVANVDFTNLGAYTELMIVGDAITASVSGTRNLLVSVNNGSTFYNTSGDYISLDAGGGVSNLAAVPAHSSAAATVRSFCVTIETSGLTGNTKVIQRMAGLPVFFKVSTSPINAIRIVNASGNLTGGSIQVYGR